MFRYTLSFIIFLIVILCDSTREPRTWLELYKTDRKYAESDFQFCETFDKYLRKYTLDMTKDQLIGINEMCHMSWGK